MSELKRTVLYQAHLDAGATMVDFGGWDMPIQYPDGIVAEHLYCRSRCAIFDVSHMGRIDVEGPDMVRFLQHVLSSNVQALDINQAQYCIIPDQNGCAIDDAYLYRFEAEKYFLVINAGNIDKDLAHLMREAERYNVTLTNVSDRYAAIAVQGPEAKKLLMTLSGGKALTRENVKNALGTLTMEDRPVRVAKTGYTGETCCTYNMLKLSRHLFCWTGDSSIADYYERALYNHILGQQDPETGMVTYFLPLLSGSHKLYSTKENSFWCCVGSGFENHAKYGEAIYYHNNQGIYVNLFIPSQVTWKEKGLTLLQETEFPKEETTRFTIRAEKPVRTTVYLRYPSWSKKAEVLVNGKKVAVKQKPGSYIAITRDWKDNDRISATYPMQIALEATPDNPNKVALLYGPLVLAGERGTEGMQAPAPFSNPALYNDYYTYNFHVPADLRTLLKVDMKHPERTLQRTGKDLKFTTEQGDVIRPLYDLHHQRYVVYWDLQSK
jgi:hypothetical protein